MLLVFLLHGASGPLLSGACESGHTDWGPKCSLVTNAARTHTHTHTLKKGTFLFQKPLACKVHSAWSHILLTAWGGNPISPHSLIQNYWFLTFHKRKVHYRNMMPANLCAVMSGRGELLNHGSFYSCTCTASKVIIQKCVYLKLHM